MKNRKFWALSGIAILFLLTFAYAYKVRQTRAGWLPLVEWTDGERGCGKFVIVSEDGAYYNFMPQKNVGIIDPVLVVDDEKLTIEFADTSPKLKFDQFGVATLRIRHADAPCLWQKTATWKPDP